jgi:hypothetical protein
MSDKPKYRVKDGKLVDAATGLPVPLKIGDRDQAAALARHAEEQEGGPVDWDGESSYVAYANVKCPHCGVKLQFEETSDDEDSAQSEFVGLNYACRECNGVLHFDYRQSDYEIVVRAGPYPAPTQDDGEDTML